MLTVHKSLFHFLRTLALVIGLVASGHASEISNQCINGNVAENKLLRESFETNKDPLRLAFLKSQGIISSTPVEKVAESDFLPIFMSCTEACLLTNTGVKNRNSIKDIMTHLDATTTNADFRTPLEVPRPVTEVANKSQNPAAKIKRECVAASMTRSPGNDGYTCSYPTAQEIKKGFSATTQSVIKPYGTAGGSSLQCIDDGMVDYVTFAVNSAIQCMSPDNPIDSRVIYKKLNNETAFNPSLAYRGGVGIGQITSPAKNEMTDNKLGRGRYILEAIAESKKPECAGFKNVAADDLKKSPQVGNSCDWVSPGNGLARSLMYTVGYYLTMRDHYVIPLLERRSPHLTKNSSLVSDFTAIAYGAEGLERARWLMQKHRAGKKTKIKDLQAKIRRDSVYLSNIKNKMKEITCIRKNIDPISNECKNKKLSVADAEADSCVTH